MALMLAELRGDTSIACGVGSIADMPTLRFTQFNVGLAFSESTANVVGYVQGTWRDGDDITSAGVTAGGRINF